VRREFSNRVKLEAFQRAEGCCELCKSGVKLLVHDIFYDHRIPMVLAASRHWRIVLFLCRSHHDTKTRKADVPAIAKSKRIQRAAPASRRTGPFALGGNLMALRFMQAAAGNGTNEQMNWSVKNGGPTTRNMLRITSRSGGCNSRLAIVSCSIEGLAAEMREERHRRTSEHDDIPAVISASVFG